MDALIKALNEPQVRPKSATVWVIMQQIGYVGDGGPEAGIPHEVWSNRAAALKRSGELISLTDVHHWVVGLIFYVPEDWEVDMVGMGGV